MGKTGRDLSRLIELVSKDVSFDELVNEISVVIGQPTCLVDDAYNILATSRGFYEQFSEFADDQQNGYINSGVQEKLLSSTISRPLGVRDYPSKFTTSWENTFVTNYFTLIYLNTVAIGSVSVLVRDGELDAESLECLQSISRLMSFPMRAAFGDRTPDEGLLISNLLKSFVQRSRGGIVQGLNAKERFALLGYELCEYKYIAFFDMSQSGVGFSVVKRMASRFAKDNDDRAIYYFEGTDVVMLVSERDAIDAATVREDAIQNWKNTAGGDTSIYCGFSDVFVDFSFVGEAVEQAKAASRFGRMLEPDKTVFIYDTYRIFDAISYMKPDAPISRFRYPPLMRLLKYDEENNTDFSFTLFHYVSNPEHLSVVCDRLGVHRNTLYYRLKRIGEIMGIEDFRKADVMMQILWTFALLRYRGRINPSASSLF